MSEVTLLDDLQEDLGSSSEREAEQAKLEGEP